MESLGATIVGEADNGRSGVELAESLDPEVVLLDVSMPVMGGLAAARELRIRMPALHIILISQHRDRAYAEEALQIGVEGYVLKRAAFNELPKALNAITAGRTFVSPSIAV
jgi:DNA-binding NarL/FixJ family response regulator